MKENNTFGVDIVDESDDYYSLLAVQDQTQKCCRKICDKPLEMEYYHFIFAKVARYRYDCFLEHITRVNLAMNYIKGSEADAVKVWNALFDAR